MTTHEKKPNEADVPDQPFVDSLAALPPDAGDVCAEAGIVAGNRHDPVLVCGVGYPLLSDLAFGTVVAYHVADLEIPGVAVCDASHTPVGAYQTLTAGDYHTAIIVGVEIRDGAEFKDGTPSNPSGYVHEFTSEDSEVPDDEELVERVGESATGSNTVKNVLVLSDAFGGLPDTTHVLTVEVGYDSWGTNVDELTAPVEAAVDDVLDRVIDLVDDAVEHDARAELDDPLAREMNTDVVEQVDTTSIGAPDTSDDPLANEWVNGDAIERLDDTAREKLKELDDGVVTTTDR